MSTLRRFNIIATLLYILAMSSVIAQTTITLEVDNPTPLPGETVTFTAKVSGDELPPLVALTDNEGDTFVLTVLSSPTLQWSMSIPSTASWARTFTVIGSIEGQRVASNEVTVVVQLDMDKLQELSFSPAESLVMYPGQTTKLNVLGHFSDGIDRYLDGKEMGTGYSERIVKGVLVTISDSPAISIDSDGRLRALQPGVADVVATNSGKTTVIRVRVIQANPAVDIDGDGIPDTKVDSDGDTIPDDVEDILGTNRYDPDSDGDTTADNIEIGSDLSLPRDSNGDGQIDALDPSIRGGIPLQSEDSAYEVHGKILDKSAIPLTNVTVQLGDQTTTTDETGHWEIKGLPPGEYTLLASKTGYLFAPKTLTLDADHTVVEMDLTEATINPATCQLYAVDDQGLNHSQFFTVSLDQQQVSNLGTLHSGYDIESLAIHPQTNLIYAASGNDVATGKPKGQLYLVDGQTGELFSVGNTGFEEIGDLAFDAQGTLWAWAKGQGLITLDVTTGAGTLVLPSTLKLAGLTLSKEAGTVFYGAVDQDLWRYDFSNQTLDVMCSNLGGKTEAVEMAWGDLLLFGEHQDKTLSLHAFDPKLCQVVAEASVSTPQHQDVEGIALPVGACR